MTFLEPCCLHRQLNEILDTLRLADDADKEATAWSHADWDVSRIIRHIGEFGENADIILCIPELNVNIATSIRDLLDLQCRANVNAPFVPRVKSVTLITNHSSADVLDALADNLACSRLTYAENRVEATVITVVSDKIKLSLAGTIPATPMSSKRGALHFVAVSMSAPDVENTAKVLMSKAKRHIIPLKT